MDGVEFSFVTRRFLTSHKLEKHEGYFHLMLATKTSSQVRRVTIYVSANGLAETCLNNLGQLVRCTRVMLTSVVQALISCLYNLIPPVSNFAEKYFFVSTAVALLCGEADFILLRSTLCTRREVSTRMSHLNNTSPPASQRLLWSATRQHNLRSDDELKRRKTIFFLTDFI